MNGKILIQNIKLKKEKQRKKEKKKGIKFYGLFISVCVGLFTYWYVTI